ncbi:hypothetical protein [Wenzhouxiangella sp. 15190]|nr:hypothetical protein [Wenzhouxiangella sp. 15190]RFF26551.1 hypothetical protein DZK25_12460 [Wenzhouxiangella sp. 15181]
MIAIAAGLMQMAAASTSITYQGQLQDTEGPVTDVVDLSFSLYETEDGNNQVGTTITRSGVEVEDGLFQVELDFGAGAFDGSPRYLEIAVDNGEPLAPRQPVSPSPTAMLSLNVAEEAVDSAQIATGSVGSDELADAVAVSELNADAVNGAVTGNEPVTSLVGDGFSIQGGALVAEGGEWTVSAQRLVPEDGSVEGITLTGDSAEPVIDAGSGATDAGVAVVRGHATAAGTAAETIGVEGRTDADADNASDPEVVPVGIRGVATGAGVTRGVVGETESPVGRAVSGFATSSGYVHDAAENAAVAIMGVTDRDNSHAQVNDAIAVFGNSVAQSGTTFGVVGRSESPDGVAVLGNSIDPGGIAVFANGDSFTEGDHGVSGDVTIDGAMTSSEAVVTSADSASETAAIHGEVTAIDSENFGVRGVTNSSQDQAAGVLGVASADSGLAQGVRGVAENGIAIEARNSGASGFQTGLFATIESDSGEAVQALASAESGPTSGVWGRSNSPDGYGVRGSGGADEGEPIGVYGQTNSVDGYGVYSADATRSEGVFEADNGIVHRQRGEPGTGELADGEVMVYNSDGSDGHNAGDLVYAVNNSGSILTETLVEKANASSLSSSAEPASRPKASLASDRTSDFGTTRIDSLERDNRRKQKRIELLEQQLEQQQQRLARLEKVLLEDRRVAEE